MMRPLEPEDFLIDDEKTIRFIKKPLKKKKQKGWRSYRNTYLKNKEVWGIYVYNGINEKGYLVLTRTN